MRGGECGSDWLGEYRQIVVDRTRAAGPYRQAYFEAGVPDANRVGVVAFVLDDPEMHVTSRGDNGITFEGTKGRIFVNRGKITGKPIEENWDEGKYNDDDRARLYKGKPHEGHKNNFYRCIREGGLPVSDVYTHVQAMNTCHLSAIAARLGRVIKWSPKSEAILGDEEAANFFARTPREGFEIPRV